jgi:thioredoxin-like negative regulator of GroEL
MSIPTMMLFKDGKPVERLVGLQTKDRLTGVVTAALA